MTVLLPPGVAVTRGLGRLMSLAMSPDGRTLVFVRPAGELRGREIALLVNWSAELERLQSH